MKHNRIWVIAVLLGLLCVGTILALYVSRGGQPVETAAPEQSAAMPADTGTEVAPAESPAASPTEGAGADEGTPEGEPDAPEQSNAPTPEESNAPASEESAAPAPGESATPAPGESATPRPGTSATPRPGTSATPRPGTSATPRPGASATPRPGTSATPRPGTSATPRPGASATPAPAETGAPALPGTQTQPPAGTAAPASPSPAVPTPTAPAPTPTGTPGGTGIPGGNTDDAARIRELYAQLNALRAEAVSQLAALADQAEAEWLSIRDSNASKKEFVVRYFNQGTALEASYDAKVDAVCNELQYLVNKTGGDPSLVRQIRAAYESEKESARAAYYQRFMALLSAG